ncbi:MAG: hypothetical protein AAGE38_11325 [Pseudomonadota bacterium]
MKYLLSLAIAGVCAAVGPAAAQSAYGCRALTEAGHLASVEGADGVFYRIDPDLAMYHPFTDETVEAVGALSDALATRGTQLVYVPVPTKSLAMPAYLPREAADFGFDPTLATTVYLDMLRRLEARGVAAVDARLAMRGTDEGLPMFHTDPRWTANGARRVAAAVGARLDTASARTDSDRARYASHPTGPVTIPSDKRSALQRYCSRALPEARSESYATARLQDRTATAAGTVLFDRGTGAKRLAVVGTEYTALAAANFAGFLSEYTGLDTIQYAVPQGGAFAAISSYLTSRAFQESPPRVLVWENPIHASLARFGHQPMGELIAAATDNCRVPLPLSGQGGLAPLVADLSALDPSQDYTLMFDSGAGGTEVAFRFTGISGFSHTRHIIRHEGQAATGRFYLPLTGVPIEELNAVEISTDADLGATPRLAACYTERVLQ